MSKNKNKGKNKNANANDPEEFDISSRDLESLPYDDPKWKDAKYIFAKQNKIKELDASKLPRELILLDLRENQLAKITGTFPNTIEVLWLDDNQLEELPIVPASVRDFTTGGNPLKPKKRQNIIESEAAASNTKQIRWYTYEKEEHRLSDEERKKYNARIYPEDVFEVIRAQMEEKIDTEKLCRGVIGYGYSVSVIKNTKHLLVEVLNKEIIAFAVIEFEKNDLKVELICADPSNKGGGSRIMDALKEYFNEHPELDRITLESIADARKFYEKKGFRPCITGKMCPMELVRGGMSGGARGRRGTRRKRSRAHRGKTMRR